ncbi:MAG: DUF4105 domain-containing protein [Gammaproteobacteria bacterium]|nr:DUF4105 domain-containing protein [Gammaproteobacteria bacterium]
MQFLIPKSFFTKIFSLLVALTIITLSSAGASVDALIDAGEFDQAAASAEGSDHYLNVLISTANTKNLHQHPMWLLLGHYKKSVFLGTNSQVDGADFFLAEDGKFDSQKELHASLAAFFSIKPVEHSKYSAQCRFPARFAWLDEQLNFDTTKLAKEQCKDFESYYEAMDPDSLTVIFPSTHPNSPSSMFGHTLLRVDKKGQTDENRMLAFSINYAAQIDPEEGMFSYTVLGLSGGFPGKFMIVPYYLKLREYAQIENRDLWEYKLDLPQERLRFVLMHTFELAYTYFDYYFFTENCSYHLLSLIDVLNAEDPMTDEFWGWTIPVDTLISMQQRQLLGEGRFYPSIARKIQKRESLLSDEELGLVDEIIGAHVTKEALAQLASLESERQILILDLLTDYLRYYKIDTAEKAVSSKLSKEERMVLLHRSRIKSPSPVLAVEPPGVSPEKGHGTSRVGVAAGLEGDKPFGDIEWRPAYHDDMDSSAGFASNSGLEFMRVKLRYLPDGQDILLQQLNVLNIVSFEPRSRFFRNLSWRANVGWERFQLDADSDASGNFHGSGGVGLSYELSNNMTSLLYAFVDGQLLVSPDYEEHYSILPMANLGYIVEPLLGLRLKLEGSISRSVLGKEVQIGELGLVSSYALSRQTNFRLEARQRILQGARQETVKASLFYYF